MGADGVSIPTNNLIIPGTNHRLEYRFHYRWRFDKVGICRRDAPGGYDHNREYRRW